MKLSVFQLVLLAVFGALAVSGMLIFAFAVNRGQSVTTVGNVTIWGTLDKARFDSALSVILQEDPSLVGVTYVQKDASTFSQALADAVAEQRGPDLYIISSDEALKNANRVVITPYSSVSEKFFRDTFVEAANPFLAQTGIIGLPFIVDPLLLYWNRDLLATAGISQPPTTWSQVSSDVQSLTVKDTSGAILTSGIALGTYTNIEDAKALVSLLIMQAANVGQSVPNPITEVNNVGELTSKLRNSSGTRVAPAEDALRFYTKFANPTQPEYSWNGSFTSARDAFTQGRVALYVSFASKNSLIHSMNPNLNYSSTYVPQLPNSTRFVTFGRSYAFAIPLNSKNIQGAFLAAQKLDTASTTLAFARAFGMAPARRSAIAIQASSDEAVIARAALSSWNWSDPDASATNDVFRVMIDSVVGGSKAIGDAVTLADQQLLHIMKR